MHGGLNTVHDILVNSLLSLDARVFKEAFYEAKGYATLEEVKRREEERELLEEKDDQEGGGDQSSSRSDATEEVAKEMEKLAVKKD